MPASTVKSATRVLQVLEYFAQVRTPLPLKRISEALGYPQSSTTVLLKNLIAMGYLRYDRTERLYFPTPRVTSLGDWISQALFGQGRIFELMHDLHGATGETVSIAMLNDIYVQYIRVIQSTHAIRFHTDEGSLRPLTRSAVGWLLLTDRTDAEVEKLVHRANIAVQGREDRVPLETHRPRGGRRPAAQGALPGEPAAAGRRHHRRGAALACAGPPRGAGHGWHHRAHAAPPGALHRAHAAAGPAAGATAARAGPRIAHSLGGAARAVSPPPLLRPGLPGPCAAPAASGLGAGR
ncbi:hypothetical protein AVMA1855_07515 [Acidovorax sp. SUPP1855]|uniref:IclR family transcriptional regulator n=1 Tax=Acidovorax sp. SUPP1855 TaxID=431774 RepID=UPI0023DE65E4|nr:helix-turn-helix domain-containing protein [Acidovorax sp. SUPP1855]GKS83977.1 hypothetical protein AVMA1855_07515 [Acidovorax sp. SUPP1855]